MSQSQVSKAEAAQERSEETRSFVRRVKEATRRRYTPEEKIRIVLEGFRREVTVSDLCRREGIKPHSYYSWTKEFMEAGRERLTRERVRDATRHEIQALRRENDELKQLVSDLPLDGLPSQKRMYKVELYVRVRRACMVEGMSTREAARVFGLHRDTVRKMLEQLESGKPLLEVEQSPLVPGLDQLVAQRGGRGKSDRQPLWQAASPRPRATWVLPVPLLPTAMPFSRR